MLSGVYGFLTIASLVMILIFAAIASTCVRRLNNRDLPPISREVGSATSVVRKLRKREPMSAEELSYARQVVLDRGSPMALAIPGMIFMLGCFFVFGSLEHLHGARPSERTFLGLIPMFTSTNLTLRLLAGARLKSLLPKSV
ncbi:hypothetical protein [Mycobacterium vicinigordonae]|uniref:Uncharacterized protein n=1 Tax=Mycobacterium vicinigordonae TaxID=1719132 RepID=A0A7D6E5L3_9MYCO|nr:hypothetical protein [Mycobacterium vicinigordonae]QLL05825.1 hypothetical protein H0P51_18675 [Mycobacterium vicinigordonae]